MRIYQLVFNSENNGKNFKSAFKKIKKELKRSIF